MSVRRPSLTLSLRASGPLRRTSVTPSSSRPLSALSSRPSSALERRVGLRTSSRAGSREPVFLGAINVVVRCRPEKTNSGIWELTETSIASQELTFGFDAVYSGTASNEQLYAASARRVVDHVQSGLNGTIFAYGATGSGKTHTMQGTKADPGLIARAAADLFAFTSSVTVSYLEIYNERIVDLLAPDLPERRLREDVTSGIRVAGLTEIQVALAAEFCAVVDAGFAARRTRETEYNARSLRSHALVMARIGSSGAILTMCDLAGSERALAEQLRRQEGAFINKSLLTLSTVIARLSARALGHVPFRDSKLTRLLQPLLSGGAVVLVVCTVRTAASAQAETLLTLRFAAKAKNIELQVSQKKEGDKDKVIAELRAELAKLKAHDVVAEPIVGTMNGLSQEKLENADAVLYAENRLLRERVEHLTRLANERRAEHVLLKNDAMAAVAALQGVLDDPGIVRLLEEVFRRQQMQMEEYTSYILHLENELRKMEISRYGEETENILPSSAGLILSKEELQRLESQQEEIEELRESLKDKERILKAMRASSRFKNSLEYR